ncbi:hypothetical protein HK096_007854, partial [Nowakowskiella sp. JEL0078]
MNESNDEEENEGDEESGEDEIEIPTRSSDEIIDDIHKYVEKCLIDRKADISKVKATHITEARRLVEHHFLASIPTQNCANCHGISPSLYKEQFHKIFEKPFSPKQKTLLAKRGMKLRNVFTILRNTKLKDVDFIANQEPDEVDVVVSHNEIQEEDAENEEEDEVETKKGTKTRYLSTMEVKAHFQLLWENERDILDIIYGTSDSDNQIRISSSDIFFLDVVPVTPTRFRPPMMLDELAFDHPHNVRLVNIIEQTQKILDLRAQQVLDMKMASETGVASKNEEFLIRIIAAMVVLQQEVNYLIDSSKAPKVGRADPPSGIKQILEKKEGLFRKHMMGKRVNYAARTVISPDPNIETSEIGIPPVFAKKLTYPEPVTDHNYSILREAVINGPTKWPGATHVQNEDGQLISLASYDENSRTSIANMLRTQQVVGGSSTEAFHLPYTNKKVYRHLRNGDFLLLNRQPTLHKPSIMAHTARILPGEKTIRMHYANCNTYNADFDGDEMNIHFPQNELGRAEAMLIARTDNQYLVPTDGGVLRGLIQDHVDAGVLMCSRDSFFTRDDYMQLIYTALRPESVQMEVSKGNGNIEPVIPIGKDGLIQILPPAIFKPKPLWSGKQIISTILMNLTDSLVPLNLKSKSKVPAKQWGKYGEMEEIVQFFEGELITGILDKSQFGSTAFGFVHSVYEVYGPSYAGKLLSVLGRLFTAYLQMVAFTCRIDDLRLTPDGDKARRKKINESLAMGANVAREFVNLDPKSNIDFNKPDQEVTERLEAVLRNDEQMAGLDSAMKTQTNKVTSSIISTCIPGFLYKSFPSNNMQVMTVSGAKGSPVNVSQISCLLGQQELEGRRVPTMVSGKTLPSFRPFDTSARAGGYITGRFLTGIKPQEYFFHCMAGREGLIDTAVKTSRSGYLQRCIIKHLEGLKVSYDQTVRDVDGSVIQFNYGEDSLDVIKSKALYEFNFCAANYGALINRMGMSEILSCVNVDDYAAGKYRKKQAKNWNDKEALKNLGLEEPVLSVFNPTKFIGSVSDKFSFQLDQYMVKNPMGLLTSKKAEPKALAYPGQTIDSKRFKSLMELKYMKSLVEPGEAVGLLAAQSIGEPSTQMTLNTFHFAGFGAKNVTLGIPRLREIIMTASAAIKTPMMRLPLKEGVSTIESDILSKKLTKVVLSHIMEKVIVKERIRKNANGRKKMITIRLKFWPKFAYREEFNVSSKTLENILENRFVPVLERAIKKEMKMKIKGTSEEEIGKGLGNFNDEGGPKKNDDDDERGDENEKQIKPKKGKDIDEHDDADAVESDDDGDSTEKDASANKREKNRTNNYGELDDEDEEIRKKFDDEDSDISEQEDENSKEKVLNKKTGKIARGLTQDEAEEVTDDDDDESDEESDEINDDDNSGTRLIGNTTFTRGFRFDSSKGRWCEVDLEFEINTKKLLMVSIVEKACHEIIISEVSGLTRCYSLPAESENDTSKNLGTEGVNLRGMWEYDNLIDLADITTNDIAAMLRVYGVEAARATIVREIKAVFGVYGISVDLRHLGLIGDHM